MCSLLRQQHTLDWNGTSNGKTNDYPSIHTAIHPSLQRTHILSLVRFHIFCALHMYIYINFSLAIHWIVHTYVSSFRWSRMHGGKREKEGNERKRERATKKLTWIENNCTDFMWFLCAFFYECVALTRAQLREYIVHIDDSEWFSTDLHSNLTLARTHQNIHTHLHTTTFAHLYPLIPVIYASTLCGWCFVYFTFHCLVCRHYKDFRTNSPQSVVYILRGRFRN